MDNNEAYSVLRFPEENNSVKIFNRISDITVRVVEQEATVPEFMDGEIHFFGECKGRFWVFETVNYDGQGLDLVKDAIRWYAEYIGMPEMQIRNVEFDL